MAPQPQSPPPVPPPVPVETHPNRAGGLKPPLPQRVPPDPTRLAPEHAYAHPQTRLWQDGSSHSRPIDGIVATPASVAALRPPPAVPGTEPRKNDIRKLRDGRRKKRKGVWKKLLWVRQSCTISQHGNLRKMLIMYRSGQLHGRRNFPRSSTKKSPPSAIRFLAPCRRFYGYCSARLFGRNICMLFRWNLSEQD